MLETDGHFREKLQAANAEDIKVRLGVSQVGGEEGRPHAEDRVQVKDRLP